MLSINFVTGTLMYHLNQTISLSLNILFYKVIIKYVHIFYKKAYLSIIIANK